MTKFEKAKNWVKENKYDIALYAYYGTCVVLGGVLIGKSVKAYRAARAVKPMPIPENWGHGKMTWLFSDPTGVMGHVADIPVEQLGTVGESLTTIPVPEKFKYANILVSFLEEEIDK